MASPTPYHDDDPPPRGMGRLYGDCSGLKGVPASEMRHRRPSEYSLRRLHRMLIIAACHDRGIAAKIVAEFLGMSAVHVRKIYRDKVKAQSRGR